MSAPADRLYELLPALYRERDPDEAYPLRALLRIVGEQADELERDVGRLWDDFFIETCRPWVIPYIGELVGNDLLFDAGRIAMRDLAGELFDDLASRDLRPPVAVRTRADVARTISYRRRKGTLAMLEELARDVTGWPAHAVEFFDLLGRSRHAERARPGGGWADLRAPERTDRFDGPFDELSHTVDVRRPAQLEGWHGVRNLGLFLWRLRSYPLEDVPARRADRGWRWHASPLGNRTPLFSAWRREGDEAGLATELHVGGPIRPAFFDADLARHAASGSGFTDLYGDFGDVAPGVPVAAGRSLFVVVDGTPVPAPQIVCARLDPWPRRAPKGRVVLVDVRAGRIAVGRGFGRPTRVDVSFHYGFAGDVGGGPYERGRWRVRPELFDDHYVVSERGVVGQGTPAVTHTSLADALADWATPSVGGRRDAVVTILDSRRYDLPERVTLRTGGRLVIEAADGQRPLLCGDEAGRQALEVRVDTGPGRRAELTLSGVVLEGFLRVTGDLGRLRLLHSTIVPGRRFGANALPDSDEPSLRVRAFRSRRPINDELRVEVACSIVGPLEIPAHADRVALVDSVVDGLDGIAIAGPGAGDRTGTAPRLVAERSTILGPVKARELEAANSIFTGALEIDRTQGGCARFCWLPPASRTPARYRCQPDLAADEAVRRALDADPLISQGARLDLRRRIEAAVVPAFASVEYGMAEYGQLHLGCPVEIRTGAEDGAEMGAFCHVKQPQREGNLRTRLGEYLPLGLEAGIVYVT